MVDFFECFHDCARCCSSYHTISPGDEIEHAETSEDSRSWDFSVGSYV